jgi:hypothetical protein
VVGASVADYHTAVWTDAGELFTYKKGLARLGSGHGGEEDELEYVPRLVEALVGKTVVGAAAHTTAQRSGPRQGTYSPLVGGMGCWAMAKKDQMNRQRVCRGWSKAAAGPWCGHGDAKLVGIRQMQWRRHPAAQRFSAERRMKGVFFSPAHRGYPAGARWSGGVFLPRIRLLPRKRRRWSHRGGRDGCPKELWETL